MTPPIIFRWDGEYMVPVRPAVADRHFVVGESYKLAEVQDRSDATHNHEFAVIRELWFSIPERFSREPWAQSPEHLRKFALIMCKFCDTQSYPCASEAEAKRWAANLRPLDEYSIVDIAGTTVFRFTAQSQSRRAMGAKRFQESKQAILEYIEDLIGVERGKAQVAA